RKILVHLSRRPTLVTGSVDDCLPVAVVRPDDNHRVMGGAAADRARPRIIDAMTSGVALDEILWIQLLTAFILVVADIMIEAKFCVLSCAAVKYRHLIIPRLFFATGL